MDDRARTEMHEERRRAAWKSESCRAIYRCLLAAAGGESLKLFAPLVQEQPENDETKCDFVRESAVTGARNEGGCDGNES